MSELFYPIEAPVGEYLMVANYNPYIVQNNQCVMPGQEYPGKYDYTKVVNPLNYWVWIIRQCENPNSEDSYFLCLIHSKSYEDNCYLGIMNMTTNICYYLRSTICNNLKISYYEDINYLQYNVPIYDIPIYDIYGGYIGAHEFWTYYFIRDNSELPIKIGDYIICNKRAMSPVIFDVREMAPAIAREMGPSQHINGIPIAAAVIREEIPVATVVQLDDDTEDNKIARLISEYKTKEELENFIQTSFIDLSKKNKKLIFDISKIESSVQFQWNIFFKSVILSVGREYCKVNKNLRFRVVNSNLEFFIR